MLKKPIDPSIIDLINQALSLGNALAWMAIEAKENDQFDKAARLEKITSKAYRRYWRRRANLYL